MADLVAAALLWTPFIGLLWYYRRGIAEVPADRYEHQLPTGLTPAVVGALFGAQRFAVDSAATTLDLVRRGVLRLERLPSPRAVETGDPLVHDHLLILDPDRVGELDEIERGLVEFLFRRVAGDSDTVSISEVRHWWHTHQNAGHTHEIWWERRATAAARYYGLVAPRAAGAVSAAAYYGAFLCVISLFFLGDGHVPARLAIFACGGAMIWLALRLPSLTARGVQLRQRYQAFRNYLHDYGRFHDKEAEQIVLWDYYLAYAVTLGLATESLWELFVVPPPLGEGTTVRTLEAWLQLRPLPPVWSDAVPEGVLRTQRRVAEALTTAPGRHAAPAASTPSAAAPTTVPASAAQGRSRTALPAAPQPPRRAPPPSTYEANVEATKKAVTNVALGMRALFIAPFVIFAFTLLLIAGCMVVAKLS